MAHGRSDVPLSQCTGGPAGPPYHASVRAASPPYTLATYRNWYNDFSLF
jgi:hypothetical protein